MGSTGVARPFECLRKANLAKARERMRKMNPKIEPSEMASSVDALMVESERIGVECERERRERERGRCEEK